MLEKRPEFFSTIATGTDDLYRKGPLDKARHDRRVREIIKGNLPDIVSHGDIITGDGKKTVKVPIRELQNPHFVFDRKKQKRYGTGQGDSSVGDIIAQDNDGQPGKGGGSEPGVDYYEAEFSVDEIMTVVFEDLELPNLEPKEHEATEIVNEQWTDVRKTGPISRLDIKHTLRRNLLRNAAIGDPHVGDFKTDDLRFRTWEDITTPESNAVVIAMMDTSGSMGDREKYIARSFYYWMSEFLKTKYDNTEIVFIAHHATALEVTEQQFFGKVESGGTICSSAYQLALDTIAKRYPPEQWNIYPYHFSDGGNFENDNEHAVRLMQELLVVSSAAGYGEIRIWQGGEGWSTLMNSFEQIHSNKFATNVLKDKTDVFPTLKKFFSASPVPVEGGVSRA